MGDHLSGHLSDIVMSCYLVHPNGWSYTLWQTSFSCFYASAAHNRRKMHYVFWSSVCSSVLCLVMPISCDTISLYLVEGFHWNLAQLFITWVVVAEKVFKVKGHRSGAQYDQMHFCSGNIHFDNVAWRLMCFTITTPCLERVATLPRKIKSLVSSILSCHSLVNADPPWSWYSIEWAASAVLGLIVWHIIVFY